MQSAKITREMIESAKAQGWYASEAARNFGVAPTSIRKACMRFNISLSAAMLLIRAEYLIAGRKPATRAQKRGQQARMRSSDI